MDFVLYRRQFLPLIKMDASVAAIHSRFIGPANSIFFSLWQTYPNVSNMVEIMGCKFIPYRASTLFVGESVSDSRSWSHE